MGCSCLTGTLPPPPFSLDDSAQSLLASRAAESLAGAATGERKVHFTPRTVAPGKFRNLPLGADPRTAAIHLDTTSGAIQGVVLLLLPLAPAPCDESGTGGFEPGVFPDRCRFADTVGWLAAVASDERPRGTPGYSIWLGDGWDETSFSHPLRRHGRHPRLDVPLDCPQSCGKL